MKTLLVVAHPRQSSLTWAVADVFGAAIVARGYAVERANLVQEGFDPTLHPPDEPDWGDPVKTYSAVVQAEMRRIERNAATVLVFPVWWWSMPAILKGWIDRVWNNGWAYGGRKLPHRQALMIGTAAGSAEGYRRRGYDEAMLTQLVVGVMNYCGIDDAELRLLYEVTENPERRAEHLLAARAFGRDFAKRPA